MQSSLQGAAAGVMALTSSFSIFETALAAVTQPFQTRSIANQSCRYLPGDDGWPLAAEWSQLNATVSGRLIETVPAAHVCHDPTYDGAQCAALRESWYYPEAHFDDPSAFMSAYHQNASCDPYAPPDTPCRQGNYVEYAIDVNTAEDVVAGLSFAQEKNIRLVVKNTGHDYLGKSTGKGALSLWMHNLKSIEFQNYTSEAYTGPAVKMGAGVQAFEAYEAADKMGLQVLGGQCVTVGVVGGYTQGGGHSLISSKYGMGSDQALEWEVVTANGTHLTATPTQNSDLYWALSGGGGGTYAVALSLVAKAYPDDRVGGVAMAFAAPSGSVDDDDLWDAVSYFQLTALQPIIDAGAHVQWSIYGPMFVITEATIPGYTEEQMRDVFAPFTTYLNGKGLPYQMNVTSFPTFYEHADLYIGPFPYGIIPSAQLQGGAMVSRDTVNSNTTGPELVSVLRTIATTSSFIVASYAINVSQPPSSPNALLPAWRNAHSYYSIFQQWNYTGPISEMKEQERLLTEEVMPPLQDLASGAYMNEADSHNPRWREEFYGQNWDRLLKVKRKWDPKSLLYAQTAVGSDDWKVEDDGRLCRA